MKFDTTKTKNILLCLILVLLVINMFTGNKNTIQQKSKVTIKTDTIWQTKKDTFKLQTTQYEKVFVYKNNKRQIVKDTVFIKDTTRVIDAKIYRDTLKNSDIEIYSYHLIKGALFDANLSYKLKVPKEITITKTITHPKTYRSGLYLFSEVGGNTQTFDNVSFGLQYNRKGKWFASYRLNVNQISKPTHNVGVGFRLFN